ncbi:MAG TPA: N-6 DNA methylase [Chitinophagaceae bacterium]|nr:N-6 DNA methylase [Chitinophagaceae bacterium]
MSEELIQTIPQKIGKYTYYRLGNSTLKQLKNHGIIKRKNYGHLETKKPDGLVTLHGQIKAVVEYKLPKNLSTVNQINKAIKQELEVARSLCKILIVTDGSKSFWINALNGEFIKDQNGNDINTVFNHVLVRNTNSIEYLIEEIDSSLTKKNSLIRSAKLIDPTPLATRLWQTIWVATGKSPIKCLYNVVELFIFKFLSDLKILPEDVSFTHVYKKAINDPADALDYYAKNTRAKIYKLFPKGNDGTTIINGTIFVNEHGDANISQAILFQRSLEHLNKYSEEFGSLTKINKEFKTKLYESFLKQEVEALGQYFTPRKVIQSVIRMAGLDEPSFQYTGKRIADPFCGVGGFIVEILNMNEKLRACYTPSSNGEIDLPFVLNGFDKGFERDDERTIILAKSNMLIYLAEILFSYPQSASKFANIFNSTFRLFKDNLGTFGHIIKEEDEKYDIILSNPPYVTTGSGIIKEEISKTPHTKDEYPINALGLEGISMEWIIKSLKPGGKTYLIIPDGILGRVGGKKLRDYILKECYLDAIVSLPMRTFFANHEHTYVLALTKKYNTNDLQKDPVFTYLISEIGERLTSVKREEIDQDDLPEMEKLFRIFAGAKGSAKDILEKESLRCRIFDIEKFKTESHWVINRWWSKEDKIKIGIEDSIENIDKKEVDLLIKKFNSQLVEYDKYSDKSKYEIGNHVLVNLSDSSLFKTFIGKRVLKSDLTLKKGNIPLYSANAFEPFGYLNYSNISNFDYPAIIWSIDGNFDFNLIQKGRIFATTDHCGTIQILDNNVLPEYLLFALNMQKDEETFDRSFRASLTNMSKFSVKIPITKKGSFDTKKQKEIASTYLEMQKKKTDVIETKKQLDSFIERFLSSGIHS